MTFLTINNHTIKVKLGAPQRGITKIGRLPRSARGIACSPIRGHRLTYPMSAVVASHEEATALEQYLMGVGHVFHFSSGTDAYTGLKPLPGYGGFTIDVVSDGAFSGFKGKLVVDTVGLLMTIPAQFTGPWTVHWWENDGGGWDHYAKRSDGAGWANGVRDDTVGDPAGTSIIEITDNPTGDIFLTASAVCDLDDLTLLRWTATESLIQSWATASAPWAPLPILRCEGDFIVQDVEFCMATNIRVESAQLAVGSDGLEKNAKKVSWVLEAVHHSYARDLYNEEVGFDEMLMPDLALQTEDPPDPCNNIIFGPIPALEPEVGDGSFSFQPFFTGGDAPYSFAGAVPDGITVDPITMLISGPLSNQGLIDYPDGITAQIITASGILSPSFAINPVGNTPAMPDHIWTHDDADKTGTDPNVNAEDIGKANPLDQQTMDWFLGVGGSISSGLPGAVNESFRLTPDASNTAGLVTAQPAFDVGAGSFALMATVKIIASTGADQTFFSRNNVGGGTSQYYLQLFHPSENIAFVVQDGASNVSSVSANVSSWVGDGQFHTVVGVFNKGSDETVMFLDGVRAGTAATAPSALGALSFHSTDNPPTHGGLQNLILNFINFPSIEKDPYVFWGFAPSDADVATLTWLQRKASPETIKSWLTSKGVWTGA